MVSVQIDDVFGRLMLGEPGGEDEEFVEVLFVGI